MATHSSVLAVRIPWTEEPGSYSPEGCKRSDTTERLKPSTDQAGGRGGGGGQGRVEFHVGAEPAGGGRVQGTLFGWGWGFPRVGDRMGMSPEA